jgi:hypothetical protein
VLHRDLRVEEGAFPYGSYQSVTHFAPPKRDPLCQRGSVAYHATNGRRTALGGGAVPSGNCRCVAKVAFPYGKIQSFARVTLVDDTGSYPADTALSSCGSQGFAPIALLYASWCVADAALPHGDSRSFAPVALPNGSSWRATEVACHTATASVSPRMRRSIVSAEVSPRLRGRIAAASALQRRGRRLSLQRRL